MHELNHGHTTQELAAYAAILILMAWDTLRLCKRLCLILIAWDTLCAFVP